MLTSEEEILEQEQFEKLIQGLMNNSFGCCDDFLLPEIVAGLRNNVASLISTGRMKSSGIGQKIDFHEDKLIRNDKVCWIEEQSVNQYEISYLEKIGRFIEYLNKTCFTSIKNFECHYASYETGSFYKRHLDQFKNEIGRKYSMVLYLNKDWTIEDQGMLCLHPLNEQPNHISPIEGRMVFFRSDEMYHEVLPSFTRERRSIAGWLKN